MARVLGRVRLSRTTEESTSTERQHESIEAWAKMHGHTIVDWAVDLDVSGSVSPFEAPDLGPWFGPEKRDEWDILVTYRLDRVSRRVLPLNELFGWVIKHGKSLASVSESIDLSTWIGRLVANVIAGIAEGELEAIRERTAGSHAKLRELGRWHGGVVPYGYRAEKRDRAWYLAVDEERAPIVREIVLRLVTESPGVVAKDLTERGVPSPRGVAWSDVHVRRIGRARWVLGQTEHDGRVVVDVDGVPVQIGEPLVDVASWTRLQAVLDDASRPRGRANGTGLLLDVAFCALCESKLYFHGSERRGERVAYWRCSNRVRRRGCKAPSIRADQIEPAVVETLLDRIGDVEVTEEVYVPGSANDERLDHIRAAIATARREYDAGLYEGDENAYLARVTALNSRRRDLEALADDRPRWEHRGTGVTFRQRWETAETVEQRRRVLLDSGIRVRASAQPYSFAADVPEDVLERAYPGYRSGLSADD